MSKFQVGQTVYYDNGTLTPNEYKIESKVGEYTYLVNLSLDSYITISNNNKGKVYETKLSFYEAKKKQLDDLIKQESVVDISKSELQTFLCIIICNLKQDSLVGLVNHLCNLHLTLNSGFIDQVKYYDKSDKDIALGYSSELNKFALTKKLYDIVSGKT